ERAAPIESSAGEHILVVEDEEALRNLAGEILKRLGYRVTVAANGGEALLLIEKKGLKPDLLITDVIMPNMSGKELVEILRENHPHLKVLYMSGYTDNAIVHHGVLDAGVHFIQKPFTINDFASKVQQVLQNKKPS
ncbi:response regulator, partial [Caldithrix abyssi]